MPIAYLDYENIITIVTESPLSSEDNLEVHQNFEAIGIEDIAFYDTSATITLKDAINLDLPTVVIINDSSFPLEMGKYPSTDEFDEKYSTDEQMGPSYSKERTIFRVFAPTAYHMNLKLDDDTLEMEKHNGYFEVTVEGDCHGKMYHFEVTHNHIVHFVVDPYAKTLNANGKRGMVIDIDRIQPDEILESTIEKQNADVIIYEANVRDMTSNLNSGVEEHLRNKFLGINTDQTSSYGLPTGIDYIKSLGVTHVQLLPVNDFATVDELHPFESYNWGYDPDFFMAPEGSYSTDPNDPMMRVKELKTLINRLHASGLKVIFDVVLNHVYGVEDNSLHKLVPNYYFRFNDDDFTLSDGTGVGNDLRTESKMFSRFVIDTINHWLHAYDIDGYRFDLMGAMDTDTIHWLRQETYNFHKDVFLLGEGWDLNTNLPQDKKTIPDNKSQVEGVTFFNDLLRDALKGHTFDTEIGGYVHGEGEDAHELRELFIGNMEPFDPTMAVNYVEAHDNHTLFDRLNGDLENTLVVKRQHQMATALAILSFGTPFIHAGQEFFRTKDGHENTYNMLDDINHMDWDLAAHEQDNIQFVRDLIQLRKDYPILTSKDINEIHENVDYIIREGQEELFALRINNGSETLVIITNPHLEELYFNISEGEAFEVLLSNVRVKDEAVYHDNIWLKPYEIIVLKTK